MMKGGGVKLEESGWLPVQLADRARDSEGPARGRGAQFSLLTTHNEEFHFPSPDKLITGTIGQSDY